MIWVAWRQQRMETLIVVGVLALLGAVLVPTGLHMASAYHHDALSACLGDNPGRGCNDAIHSFTSRFQQVSDLLGWLTLLPGLIGVLLAAPFVLQLESGTYRLDWTQSITRGRWIAGKLALAVGAALLFSLAYTELATWWRTPLVRLQGRMDPSVFDSEGVVVFGYTLFALGLGLAIGVIWRRAVAALVVSFVGYFAVRLFVDTWLRQKLTPPETGTLAMRKGEPAVLHHALVISSSPSDRLGHRIPLNLAPCKSTVAGARRCATDVGGFMHAVYEPASRFWSMQVVELGLFAGLAAALIALAAWWTHTRTA